MGGPWPSKAFSVISCATTRRQVSRVADRFCASHSSRPLSLSLARSRSRSRSRPRPPSLPLSLSLFLSLSLSPSSLSFSLRFRMFGQLRWSEKPRQVRRGKQQIEAIGFHSVNLGPRVTFVKLRMAFSFSSARSTMPSPMAGRIRCCSKMPCISMKEKHKEICLNLRH